MTRACTTRSGPGSKAILACACCMKRWSNRWYRVAAQWSIPACSWIATCYAPRAGVQRATAGADHPAHREAGTDFNMDSPKQLQQILFEKAADSGDAQDTDRQPSTAEECVGRAGALVSPATASSAIRALAKLKRPTRTIARACGSAHRRIHTTINSGRANRPALLPIQPANIRSARPEGRRIRQAFIAPPGYVLMAADYSQIELRTWPHRRAMKGLLSAFAEDRDVHQATAAEVFSVPVDSVSADQRRTAKPSISPHLWMSPFGLARQLGIGRATHSATGALLRPVPA